MKCDLVHLKGFFPIIGQNDCDPCLSVYLPDNLAEMGREAQKRPVLLICPGGGYGMCSQREAEPIALHFLPEGFNVFVLWYSCAPSRFPTQLCEVAAAMELIDKHAQAWHCDTSRIALMGFSAGGHLAAHYATAYACEQVRTVFPESKPVQASVLCYPVITADPQWAHLGSFDNLTGKTERTPEEIARLSCENLVTAQTPPAFLWHTAEDPVVPVMNSLLYAKALAARNILFELHIYPYGGHGLSTCDAQTLDQVCADHNDARGWMDAAKKWLKRIWEKQS